jgi:hypothetical protein
VLISTNDQKSFWQPVVEIVVIEAQGAAHCLLSRSYCISTSEFLLILILHLHFETYRQVGAALTYFED